MALEEGFAAVYAGDAAALEAWLSQGGDANARVPFDDNLEWAGGVPFDDNLEEWAGGATLLRSALVSKKSTKHDVIRALLQRGADPNLNPYSRPTSAGWTTLHYAAFWHDTQTAAMLIEAGASVDACGFPVRGSRLGWAALSHAFNRAKNLPRTRRREVEFAALLLRHGASLEPFDYLDDDDDDDDDDDEGTIFALVRDVRRAGSWQKFVNEPRARLVVLRTLCERGRATPPRARHGGAATRLFETRSRGALPPPVFFHVLSFWRTDRDSTY